MTVRWVAPIFVALSLVLAGCLGWGSFDDFGDFGDFDDDFPMPTVLAVYTQGTATLEIKQGDTTQKINLTRVAAGSQLMSLAGGTVTWRSDDGWGLQIMTFDMAFPFEPGASPGATPGQTAAPYLSELAVIRIADHDFWRASSLGVESGNRCIVDLTEASATRVTGTATCRGLKWYDGTASPMTFEQVYIDGQEPFDAEITFEAMP